MNFTYILFFIEDSEESVEQLSNIFRPILKLIQKDILKASLVSLDLYIFPTLHLYAGWFYFFYYYDFSF